MASKRRPAFSQRATSIWKKVGCNWAFVEESTTANAQDRMMVLADANPQTVYKIAEYRPKPTKPRD